MIVVCKKDLYNANGNDTHGKIMYKNGNKYSTEPVGEYTEKYFNDLIYINVYNEYGVLEPFDFETFNKYFETLDEKRNRRINKLLKDE